jgi:transposase-like protein
MEAMLYFSDLDRAEAYIASIKWPDGPVCPGCGCQNVGFIASRRRYQCREKACRKQFSLTTGTIMEASHLRLERIPPTRSAFGAW